MQGPAVRECDLQDAAGRAAIFDRLDNDRNFIARFEGLLGPAEIGHVRRIARFGDPMYDFALVVLRIEFQEAVRIGPEPLRDCSGQSEFFPCIKRRRAMVCEQQPGR